MRPIIIGRFNRIGWLTLYQREVMRFVKIIGQTVAAPVVTTWLLLTVFAVALGDRVAIEGEIDFINFLAPGLVMMATLQNAFANPSSSLVISKVQGNIIDILMPPLSSFEVVLAMGAAGVTRGIAVGIVTLFTMSVFGISVIPAHPLAAIMFLLLGSIIMSLGGIITGIWADKFDNLATITNFVIQPLIFLSGTFYSIDNLPPPFDLIGLYNPMFYVIDGFRYAMIGSASASPLIGCIVLSVLGLVFGWLALVMLASGYKLKS